ncbi:hypothetical protein M0R45_021894 [Rubus argutus]|uniref:Uncharacterized protein n=1 Tax=Rubus argutus TaxID=59490 RepID=A0AAW1XEW9_RUBAR
MEARKESRQTPTSSRGGKSLRRRSVLINGMKRKSLRTRNATGGGTKYMDGGLRAVLESNEEEDGDAKKKENVGWDLNADPEPECDLN